jgi:hypothetical protein
MNQVNFRISADEFNLEFLEKIKLFFNNNLDNFDVVISIRPKETPEAAKLRIDKSINNIERSTKD